MSGRNKADKQNYSSANLGFEAKLWLATDKLRNNMDATEYKHVVLGLIFLKYISDSFDEHHAKLGDISIYGQGSNPTTRRPAIMDLALRGIEADFGPENADIFRRDSASNPLKPNSADGNRPTTTFFKN